MFISRQSLKACLLRSVVKLSRSGRTIDGNGKVHDDWRPINQGGKSFVAGTQTKVETMLICDTLG